MIYFFLCSVLINICKYDIWLIKFQCYVIGEFYYMLIYINIFMNFLKRCVKEFFFIYCLENVVYFNIWRKYSCCLIVQNLVSVVCLVLFVFVYCLLVVVVYVLIFLLGEYVLFDCFVQDWVYFCFVVLLVYLFGKNEIDLFLK